MTEASDETSKAFKNIEDSAVRMIDEIKKSFNELNN